MLFQQVILPCDNSPKTYQCLISVFFQVVSTIKNLKYLRNLEKWQRSQILFRFEYTPHWVAKPNWTPSTVWAGKLSKFEQMIDGAIVKIFLTQKRKTYTTISAKFLGKTAIWIILYFSPLRPLNNVEEQWTKLASSNVIDPQHCLGGEGGF